MLRDHPWGGVMRTQCHLIIPNGHGRGGFGYRWASGGSSPRSQHHEAFLTGPFGRGS